METMMDERFDASRPAAEVAPERSLAGHTNGKAIASLVLGIVGLTGLPFVCSILAVVFGRGARREIAASGEGGEGLATAGIVLGWVGILLVLLVVLLVGAIFSINFVSGS
jgi:hypothetical protein